MLALKTVGLALAIILFAVLFGWRIAFYLDIDDDDSFD